MIEASPKELFLSYDEAVFSITFNGEFLVFDGLRRRGGGSHAPSSSLSSSGAGNRSYGTSDSDTDSLRASCGDSTSDNSTRSF